MAVTPTPSSRRSRRLGRLVPLLVLAAGAFAGGLVAGGRPGPAGRARREPAERRLAARFAAAWERGDYAAMYSMLTPAAQDATSVTRFARAYRSSASTATTVRLTASRPS